MLVLVLVSRSIFRNKIIDEELKIARKTSAQIVQESHVQPLLVFAHVVSENEVADFHSGTVS